MVQAGTLRHCVKVAADAKDAPHDFVVNGVLSLLIDGSVPDCFVPLRVVIRGVVVVLPLLVLALALVLDLLLLIVGS